MQPRVQIFSLMPHDFIKIKEGHWILLKLPSQTTKLVFAKAGQNVDLGRYGDMFDAGQLIGLDYGRFYELALDDEKGDKEGDMGTVTIRPLVNPHLLLLDDASNTLDHFVDTEDSVPMLTNEALIDDNTSQSLTTDQIEQLKQTTLVSSSGSSTLVSMLISSSRTYAQKNIHAQAKYRARKHRKYARHFQIKEPLTPLSLTQHLCTNAAMTKKGGTMIGPMYMREDALAHVMYSLPYGSCYGVWDEFKGIITATLAWRMQEIDAKIYALHDSKVKSWTPGLMSYLFDHPLIIDRLVFPVDPMINEINLSFKEPDIVFNEEHKERVSKARDRHLRLTLAKETFFSQTPLLDSIVLAIREPKTMYSLIDLISKIESRLKPSGALLVYCPFSEPLAILFDHLMTNRKQQGLSNPSLSYFIDVRLEQCSLQQWQPIPGRMHPEMKELTACWGALGGYLLKAIKIVQCQR